MPTNLPSPRRAYADGRVSPLRVATGGAASSGSKARPRRSPPARMDGAATAGIGWSNRRPTEGLRMNTKTTAKT